MLIEHIVGELADLGDTIHTSVDFNEKESVVDEVLELVLLYDAGRNDSDMTEIRICSCWSMGVLQPLMPIIMNFALGVDRTLLDKIFAISISALERPTSPGY
jgi:hypothetical protein